jgi:hypothetical protein
MIRPFLALAALSAIAAAPAVAPVLQLAKETATVENAEGEPLFVIRDLAYLAETYGSAVSYDRLTQRVRVTPVGQPSLWIRCSELAPAEGLCIRRPNRVGPVRDEEDVAGPLSRNLPDCPGDPRCPRRGSK